MSIQKYQQILKGKCFLDQPSLIEWHTQALSWPVHKETYHGVMSLLGWIKDRLCYVYWAYGTRWLWGLLQPNGRPHQFRCDSLQQLWGNQRHQTSTVPRGRTAWHEGPSGHAAGQVWRVRLRTGKMNKLARPEERPARLGKMAVIFTLPAWYHKAWRERTRTVLSPLFL